MKNWFMRTFVCSVRGHPVREQALLLYDAVLIKRTCDRCGGYISTSTEAIPFAEHFDLGEPRMLHNKCIDKLVFGPLWKELP